MSTTLKRLWLICLIAILSGCGDWFSTANSKTKNNKKSTHVTEVVSEQDFNTMVLKSDKPVVVDFWATWCGACKTMLPIFSKLAGEMNKDYKFVSIDIDKAKGLANKYGVTAIPTFLFFDGGQKKGQIVGGQSEAAFKKAIEDNLKQAATKSGTTSATAPTA
ncbi:MAG: thioredoxin [Epsilonproteobacteria bacterium]|nr:thioredoxin [Campylobacterota bacterium]